MSAGRVFSPSDHSANAAVAFSRVFEAFEPFGQSFASTIPRRLLIHPTDAFGPGREELPALLAAADAEDLARVFISAAEPKHGADDPDLYVLAPLDEHTYLRALEPWTIVPHAIYPPSGEWGVMTTNEGYAVAGGSEPFIAKLLQALGRNEDEMIATWLDELANAQRGAADGGRHIAEWAPEQLAHIIGPERAERALRSSQLLRHP
jgi:hypothetical protein